MSILMVYMVVASIICAIQAVRQGGTTNSVMLFSILITFGCVYFSLSTVKYVMFLITSFLSICIQQLVGVRPLAYHHQLYSLHASFSHVHQHVEHVC